MFRIFSLAAAVAILQVSCVTPSLPTAAEAGLSFRTQAMDIPADLQWSKRSAAHELINAQELMVVVSGGDNPISDADWTKYKPPLPWIKNIERNLLFDGSNFLRSPHSPEGAAGPDRYAIRKVSGRTWVELAQPIAVDFVPPGQKTDMMKPEPGHLVIKTILKPQVLRWNGPIWQLTDNQGNYFVMHAFEDPAGPTGDVILPEGWSLEKTELPEPLIITPSQGGYYNVVGDCLGQGYHQYIFADATYPKEQMK